MAPKQNSTHMYCLFCEYCLAELNERLQKIDLKRHCLRGILGGPTAVRSRVGAAACHEMANGAKFMPTQRTGSRRHRVAACISTIMRISEQDISSFSSERDREG